MSNQLQHFFVIQKYTFHPYLDTLVYCTDFMIHVSVLIYPLHTVLNKKSMQIIFTRGSYIHEMYMYLHTLQIKYTLSFCHL